MKPHINLEGEIMGIEPEDKEIWEKSFCVGNASEIEAFANSVGITNLLCRSAEVARKAGMPDVVAPHSLLHGFLEALIGENTPGSEIKKMELEFQKPVSAGTTVLISCQASHLNRFVYVAVMIMSRDELVATGSCTLQLPS